MLLVVQVHVAYQRPDFANPTYSSSRTLAFHMLCCFADGSVIFVVCLLDLVKGCFNFFIGI
jgi:hypothetical protein